VVFEIMNSKSLNRAKLWVREKLMNGPQRNVAQQMISPENNVTVTEVKHY